MSTNTTSVTLPATTKPGHGPAPFETEAAHDVAAPASLSRMEAMEEKVLTCRFHVHGGLHQCPQRDKGPSAGRGTGTRRAAVAWPPSLETPMKECVTADFTMTATVQR